MKQCLGYPDAYTCRRCTRIGHRILETVAWSPRYEQLLGNQMFLAAAKNIVTEPKWMVGIEWDMINLLRDIYCRLVLGQTLQPGGQGPGLQQPRNPNNPSQYEQAKAADKPLQGGGVLVDASNLPRQILASLPGVGIDAVNELDKKMTAKRSAKDQVSRTAGVFSNNMMRMTNKCVQICTRKRFPSQQFRGLCLSFSEGFSPRLVASCRREFQAVGIERIRRSCRWDF